MRLEVDVSGYTSAADALFDINEAVARARGTLTSALAGYGAMGGNDMSSEEFVSHYDAGAREMVGAIGDVAMALGTLATLTEASGANHLNANTRSIYRRGGGGEEEWTPDRTPVVVGEYTPPSALGGDSSDTPRFWDIIVDHLQGWAWPSADTERLRSAAASWRAAADQLDAVPNACQTADGYVSVQRSPEVPLASRAFTEVGQAATDLATECRNLADACEEYAEKVDTTKDVVRDLLEGLAIEVGITAVVSGLGSLITFGGASAAGAAVAGSRAVSCARKIIAALQGIRAIRAIGVMVRTVDKATDVRHLLSRYRSARNLRHRPTGHLPPRGKPNSYGYDADGVRLPYANSRPSYGNGQVDEVWRRAQDPDGNVWVLDRDGNLIKIDWQPGQPRRDVWDMGHVSGAEYRTLRDDYLSGRITKEEFLDAYRNPDLYEVAHPGRNRSGIDEAIPRPRPGP